MASFIDTLLDISHLLIDDVHKCQDELLKNIKERFSLLEERKMEEANACKSRGQFWRRAYARAFFAYVEGNLYQMKQVAYAMRNEPSISFSEGDILLMREEAYELKDNGTVRTTKAKLKLEYNFRFAFQVYGKAIGKPLGIDYGTEGWKALRSSILVRDRLMHPKEPEKMTITDDEEQVMTKASLWFSQLVEQVWQVTEERAPYLPDWLIKL